jgi:hypothetical protein
VDADLLDRVRKLLAKAEDEGCSPAEAEALTAKAADLMARYGIDRALLGALHPETDRPADRVFTLANPWGDVKRHLLAGLAMALRCQCVQTRSDQGTRLHVFGYTSDLERADILYTSLLVQMARALAKQAVPASGGEARAWRRSWMLGYCTAVVTRVRAAEESAVASASGAQSAASGQSAALVLADRSLVVRRQVSAAYPRLRKTRVTYSGSGYGDGYREGQKADIGSAKLRSRSAGALGRLAGSTENTSRYPGDRQWQATGSRVACQLWNMCDWDVPGCRYRGSAWGR